MLIQFMALLRPLLLQGGQKANCFFFQKNIIQKRRQTKMQHKIFAKIESDSSCVSSQHLKLFTAKTTDHMFFILAAPELSPPARSRTN
jgi:hypothetical protein